MPDDGLFPRYMSAEAEFSPCWTYRYRLHRIWDHFERPEQRLVTWVMLNSSTADAVTLDPTVRKCEGFSRLWGFDGFEVVNLFPFCSPDPRIMKRLADPLGDEALANYAILDAATTAALVVCAWGTHGVHRNRETVIRKLLRDSGVTPVALNLTKDGHPQHPLYVSYRLKDGSIRRPVPFLA